MSSLATDFERMALLGAGAFALYAYMNHQQSGDGLHKKADSCGHGGPCYPAKRSGGNVGRERNVETHGDTVLKTVTNIVKDQFDVCTLQKGLTQAIEGCPLDNPMVRDVAASRSL